MSVSNVDFIERCSDDIGWILLLDEVFRHNSTLVGVCVVTATNPPKAEELAVWNAVSTVSRVSTDVVQIAMAICGLSVLICLYSVVVI